MMVQRNNYGQDLLGLSTEVCVEVEFAFRLFSLGSRVRFRWMVLHWLYGNHADSMRQALAKSGLRRDHEVRTQVREARSPSQHCQVPVCHF